MVNQDEKNSILGEYCWIFFLASYANPKKKGHKIRPHLNNGNKTHMT